MFKKLPQPTTFAEGQRKLFGLLMIASGLWAGFMNIALTVFFCVLAFLFPDHRLTILYVLAGALLAANVAQTIVMVSLALGGPVGRFKVTANKDGASLEADGDGEPISPSVTTMTATMEVPHE